MKPIVFIFPGNEQLGKNIITGIYAEEGNFALRNFPDGETYVRVNSEVKDRHVIIVCSLHRPDTKFLSLFFFCKLLRDKKVKSIYLVVPYIAYMRQDMAFNPGEAVTSTYFAQLLSSCADRLITIDPHLHRRATMQEIYSIPCEVLHGSGLISQWIKHTVSNAVLIGPDKESEQWVSEVAKNAEVPFVVLEKVRHGDRDVELKVPSMENYKHLVPVLVDDIISTAHTMIETVKQLKSAGMKAPICIAVHGIFAEHAYEELLAAGAADIVTTNTIVHVTNKIDVSQLVINCLKTENEPQIG
jgi:ribose-phosphate pyrophosphokinase